MSDKNIKIYIAAHKPFDVPKDDIYVPLQVGAEGKDDFGYQKDNDGENISAKNYSFCELTGMYWMWKQAVCDIIGLVHYRRYFFRHYLMGNKNSILQKDEIETLLNKYDIIVPLRGFTYQSGNVIDQYVATHLKSDLDVTENVVKELYPEYADAYQRVMTGYYYSQYNMMICKKDLYDNYCEWMFGILFEVEKRIGHTLKDRDVYNQRVYGFLSERLLNVWLCKHNEIKVCELPVYNVEDNLRKEKLRALIKKVFFIRGSKLF